MIAPELVDQARRGDQRALGDLLAALRPQLVRYCTRKLGPNDGEDAAQEALARLMTSLGAYRRRWPIEAYACLLASNCVADAFRRKYRDKAHPVADVPEQGSASGLSPAQPEEHVLRAELAGALAAQVRTLPGRQKDIVLLRVVHSMSAEETAHLLDTTPGAVRVAQHRAVRRLRKTVAGAL